MSTYKICYKEGALGIRRVEADTLQDFLKTDDAYVFTTGDDIVAVNPQGERRIY